MRAVRDRVTPVHVFTSGDEGELFLNGRSLGRKAKGPFEYRLRWDEVVYEPGTLEVVAYKDGTKWATDWVRTAQPAARLEALPDRARIRADGRDLSFVTVRVVDERASSFRERTIGSSSRSTVRARSWPRTTATRRASSRSPRPSATPLAACAS